MVWLHAETFFGVLSKVRVAAIVGLLGTGKTLLSVAIAHRLLLDNVVDSVWANFPTVLPSPIKINGVRVCRRVCYILDESWLYADSRNSSNTYSRYGAFCRKIESVFLSPSVNPPDKRMRHIEIVNIVQLPHIWIYKYSFFDTRQSDWFGLFSPELYYGTYDTQYIPSHDNGIGDLFRSLTNEVSADEF